MNQLVYISYMTLVFDNLLLTMVVPILPDYLNRIDHGQVSDHDQAKHQINYEDTNFKKYKNRLQKEDHREEYPRGFEKEYQNNHSRGHKNGHEEQNHEEQSKENQDKYSREHQETYGENRNQHGKKYQIEHHEAYDYEENYRNEDQNSNNSQGEYRKPHQIKGIKKQPKEYRIYRKEHQISHHKSSPTDEHQANSSVKYRSIHNESVFGNQSSNFFQKSRSHFHPFNAYAARAHQTGNVGVLLSTHGFLQFAFNGIAGHSIRRLGHFGSQTLGLLLLLLSAFVYSVSEKFFYLVLARGLHGVGSSFLIISAMSMIAKVCNDEEERCIQMGTTMSGIGVGVLIGYPYGGIAYQLFGKRTPFLIFIIFLLVLLVFQVKINIEKDFEQYEQPNTICTVEHHSFKQLLSDRDILTVVFTIGVSTMCIATLEPCLPIWLINNFKPAKWQLGLAFIPDSVGYLLGTKYLSSYVLYFGRWTFSKIALTLVALSAITIPLVGNIYELILPHFALGLSIGAIDAAMNPMLAHIVDVKFSSDYGMVYAIAQIAVCTAYGIAPLIGSQLADMFGFNWLMRLLALLNISQALLIHLLVRNNVLISVDSVDHHNQLQEDFNKLINRIKTEENALAIICTEIKSTISNLADGK